MIQRSEEDKIYRKLKDKKSSAAHYGLKVYLTLEDYKLLMMEAGITADQIQHNGYHLARYNDTGHYSLGTCRFIPYTENIKERKTSESVRESRSISMKNNISHEARSSNGSKVCRIAHEIFASDPVRRKIRSLKMVHGHWHTGIFDDCKICQIKLQEVPIV
jgi:hypothetical protein